MSINNDIRQSARKKGVPKLLSLVFLVLGLVVGAVHLFLDKQPRTKGRVAEIFLLWLLVITVGIQGISTFIAHTIYADATAASIGWPAGNPFQSEVAVANLSVGVLGILCYWMRGSFWNATVIGFSVMVAGRCCGAHQEYSSRSKLRT